jgi:hypothetical protein
VYEIKFLSGSFYHNVLERYMKSGQRGGDIGQPNVDLLISANLTPSMFDIFGREP